MYTDELTPERLSIDAIFLDPNNPRFRSRSERRVPDSKVPDETKQSRTMRDISGYGIEELCNSILRNGFLPLDRIVVRALAHNPDQYVVVEGNRRTAAIKTIIGRIDDDEIDKEDLSEEYLAAMRRELSTIECLVYSGGDDYIAWMLQGIRHLSGIKSWAPSQRAELIVKQKDEDGRNFTEIGEVFGLTNQQVGRLYRGYKGLEQMRENEEFGAKADPKFFTLFDEAWKNRNVRKWLDWSDSKACYENDDGLRLFYSWIIPDEDHEESRRRLHDPRHVKVLDKMLAAKAYDLIDKVNNHALTIENAEAHVTDHVQGPPDWELEIKRAVRALKEVPAYAIKNDAERFKEAVAELQGVLEHLLGMAE